MALDGTAMREPTGTDIPLERVIDFGRIRLKVTDIVSHGLGIGRAVVTYAETWD